MLLDILKRLKNENFYWTIGFYALVLAGTTHFIFIFLFYFLDVPILSFVNIFSVFIYIYCIFGLGLKTLETKDDHLIGWLVYFELIGHGGIATYYLGLESGFIYYIVTLIFIPFFVLSYTNMVRIVRVTGVVFVIFALELWGHNYGSVVTLESNYITFLHYMNLTIVLFSMSVISYFYSTSVYEYQKLLYNQSNKDPLTNLFNRRYVDDVFENNMVHSEDKGIGFGLLLIDIDRFKKINDKYGHKWGDKVLIVLSRLLKENLRESTIVSRWGGEEFLIILENTNQEELLYIGERLRTVVENTVMVEEKNIKITITLGGAIITNEDETFEMLLARADKALYKGKKNGRNQVTVD